MKRKITEKLIRWKNKKAKKPLILYGARQVGKTYAIKEFGKHYFDDVIYVNFETNARLAKDFDDDISPAFLLNRLELFFGRTITPENTLIFFDEVQACERALTSLKYFCEEAPEYHVIAAGSLLGVAVNREKYSFPVGKVEMLHLYPMDFEEYLWALRKELLAEKIRTCFHENTPMDRLLHETAMELYRAYLIMGGMPGVLAAYLEKERMIDAGDIQNTILNAYVADMSKYITAQETAKAIACFNSIPAQLAKDNRKFQYKVIQKGGKASLFGAALDWLHAAGIITICDKVTQGFLPPEIYKDLSSFKIYMSDVGLLTQKSMIVPHDVLTGNAHRFIGALTENYVANALVANGYSIYYWTSGSQAEVDFVVQDYDRVLPIEVKSDLHVKSRSLSVYVSKYKPELAIRVSGKNFGFENGMKSVPLYAAFCIEPRKPKER